MASEIPKSKETMTVLHPDAMVLRVSGDAAELINATALAVSLDATSAANAFEGPGFAVQCTGDTAALPGGGVVAIVGQPYFRDPSLQAGLVEEGAAQTIANLYIEKKGRALDFTHGAFALCIFDAGEQRLTAAIDRLGQHTLYFASDTNGLTIATSASALMGATGAPRTLRPQGIYNYVYFHMVPAPAAIYRDVEKLQAAHKLVYDAQDLTVGPYWTPTFKASSVKSTAELGAGLRQTLRQAVRNCLPVQGKVGAFLSGGLDSSTVTGVMAELCGSDAQAYAIGFDAQGYDEMPFARTTAEHFGVKLNEYYVTPEDVVNALPLIATSYDEPFGNSSALPAYFCARMASENGTDTLLAGDGGDELFAGNERYAYQRLFKYYDTVPRWLRTGLIEPLLTVLPAALPLVGKGRGYVQQAKTPLPDRLQNYNFLHRHQAGEIFTDSFLSEVDVAAPLALLRAVYARPENTDELNRMLFLDWQITLADNDLRKVSHMCAAAGVKVSYPMIDDELVDFSCSVPSDKKLRGSDLRHFYKQALTGWLPDATINKSKQGFGLPFGVWMRSYPPLRELAYDHLVQLKSRQIIRPEFIDRAIELHQSEHAAYYGELVWILTVFELWMTSHAQDDNS